MSAVKKVCVSQAMSKSKRWLLWNGQSNQHAFSTFMSENHKTPFFAAPSLNCFLRNIEFKPRAFTTFPLCTWTSQTDQKCSVSCRKDSWAFNMPWWQQDFSFSFSTPYGTAAELLTPPSCSWHIYWHKMQHQCPLRPDCLSVSIRTRFDSINWLRGLVRQTI